MTDRRVQKMNEILNSIKFIKMYAWVKAFSQEVRRECPAPVPCLRACLHRRVQRTYPPTGIREEERKILAWTGYFQSITVGVAPVVVVIASVATFSAHMLLGYDLTAAQV